MEAAKKQQWSLLLLGFLVGVIFMLLISFVSFSRQRGTAAKANMAGPNTSYDSCAFNPTCGFWNHMFGVGGGGSGSSSYSDVPTGVRETDGENGPAGDYLPGGGFDTRP
jgi:hypothetical protein